MNKQLLKKKFPFLIKVRKKQINFCFYSKMYLDKNKYCKKIINEELPYSLQQFKDKIINPETGFPIEYQYNKAFNVQLASKKINHLIIKPNETFSFYMSIHGADKNNKYKKGLSLVNGEIKYIEGGGMCQLSNLLFQMFLHSPLMIVERHTHEIKDFPDAMQDALKGIDATIAEGFLDLKVKNCTNNIFQICISFDDKYIYGELKAKNKLDYEYKIINRNLRYTKENNKIYEYVDIYRQEVQDNGATIEKRLYTNKTEIAYKLPEYVNIESEE